MLGTLRKMQTALTIAEPVQYQLPLTDALIPLNPLLGNQIRLIHSGKIACVHCQRATKKTFNQGYCYRCFTQLAQCDLCIMKPELCHYEQGTCREPRWGEEFCWQPHIVYLANTSGLKVGITRATQTPTRWIDQGAVQALPIMKVKSRYLSGLLEVQIARYVSDKTSWQKMLKSTPEAVDLVANKHELLARCKTQIIELEQRFGSNSIEVLPDERSLNIEFPVAIYPLKVKSFNFDKTPEVCGTLQGIKGQYLLFDSGVINIRKFAGYEVDLIV